MTYKEARTISDNVYAGTDYVLEYDDAFVFIKMGSMVLGVDEGPNVILKENGDNITYFSYLTNGDHELIREFAKC